MKLSTILQFLFVVISSSAESTRNDSNSNSNYSFSILNFDLSKLQYVTTIDKRFLSINLDSRSLARHWKTVDLKNPKLIVLTKQLAPAYLRVGGTDQDNLYFCSNDVSGRVNDNEIGPTPSSANITMTKITESDITDLGNFIQNTGLDLIYGLNALGRRNNDQDWDPTNSLQLMSFMNKIQLSVVGWELGNEPRRFPKVFNKSVSAKSLGRDVKVLKGLLRLRQRQSTSIFGPDLSRIQIKPGSGSQRYMANFLQQLDPDTISAVTFHHYYFAGSTATPLDFLNPSIMDQLKPRIRVVQEIVRHFQPNLPIWIGETSSAYGGGSPNLSDRFISSFMWLDKLGQSALYGISGLFRQALFGGNYGLLDSLNRPTPSYFISYIFKQLVGNVVLKGDDLEFEFLDDNLEDKANRKTRLRFYIHCDTEMKGGIVLFGINLQTRPITIQITGNGSEAWMVSEYRLTPPGTDLTSKYCNLNGKKLRAGRDGTIPKLRPVMRRERFKVPEMSLGFWVVKNANISVCRKNGQ